MSYRLARSLEKLRDQINDACPNRSKRSDGWIGDPRHRSRASDHNPWVKDGGTGVVTAFDITHDPANGVDARELAESLIASRDPRIKYIISEGQIASSKQQPWKWRKYTGPNGHFHHVHISVIPEKALYDDTADWQIARGTPKDVARFTPVLKRDSRENPEDAVKQVQCRLVLTADGKFGPATEAAVKAFQKQHGLTPDGIVGPATWAKLIE